jgi:hypothetical protein
LRLHSSFGLDDEGGDAGLQGRQEDAVATEEKPEQTEDDDTELTEVEWEELLRQARCAWLQEVGHGVQEESQPAAVVASKEAVIFTLRTVVVPAARDTPSRIASRLSATTDSGGPTFHTLYADPCFDNYDKEPV